MVTELKPTGVEEWAQWLSKQPMTKLLDVDQRKAFIHLHFCELINKGDDEHFDVLLQRNAWNFASVLYYRVKDMHTYEMTKTTALFMAGLMQSPAHCVIYANYLEYELRKRNKKKIDLSVFCEIFPVGVFEDATLQEAWERQKYHHKHRIGDEFDSDNMLDYSYASTSLTSNIDKENE